MRIFEKLGQKNQKRNAEGEAEDGKSAGVDGFVGHFGQTAMESRAKLFYQWATKLTTVRLCVCVCAAQRVANLLHAAQTVQKVNWLRQFRVCPVRPSTCSCDQWLSAVRQVVPTGPCPMCLKTRLPSTLAAQSQTGDRRAMNKFLRSFYNKLFSLDISL